MQQFPSSVEAQPTGGDPGWAPWVQPLLCPWTSLLSRSALLRGFQAPSPYLLPWHRAHTASLSSPVLLPNSCPALEFFMGFYLVLTGPRDP